ncbi:MAG: amidohydrolase family protein [Xanthomonadales bacterium]|nr:N-substituted formamide deformylase [Xanthomonadales bacterium]MCC6592638.1 amidohydrolase family protein [Xanthomonadales bacterium]MCE7931779.1 amidohydrolase [Xanthomonadales bacterium PRO6]
MRRSPFLSCLLVAASALAQQGPGPDTLALGRIHLRADAEPVAALAWDAQGRVIAAGAHAQVRAQLEQRGRGVREHAFDGVVLPGLIDAHGHLLGLGSALLQVDLVGSRDLKEIRARLRTKARALAEGDWLIGRGWDQNDWPAQEFPSAADLDRQFPERPVWLTRIDGHAGWANSAAMRVAGIDATTPDPPGGRLLRDAAGKPTGVFVDTAMDLVQARLPAHDRAWRRRALVAALHAASAAGLTGVHDAGVSRADLGLMRELADEGALPLRIYAMADGASAALDWLCKEGPYRHPGGRLQMRAVKLYADGALGSRGAALLADYADDAGNRGLLVTSEAALRAAIERAAGCGVQPAVHAIGDRANRIVLDAYARLDRQQRMALRPRIEHAQVVDPTDIPRFAELGVIASMQPTHATSDMPWAQARIGAERLRGAYAWRRLLDSGAKLALGSDFPVERVEPVLGLYAAATRQDARGEPADGWLPDQRMRLEEALDGFTRGAAWAGFAEAEVGSLEVGKRADFIVLTADPRDLRGRALLTLRVKSTWLDGERVWPR